MTDQRKTFRAGDHVFHKPTGETWVLACDQEGNNVICAGWPESLARASDCEIRHTADDTERLDMLTKVSTSGQTRGAWAKRQLDASP